MLVCRETTGKLGVISEEAVIDAVKRYINASGGMIAYFSKHVLHLCHRKAYTLPTVEAPGATPQLNEGWIKKLI